MLDKTPSTPETAPTYSVPPVVRAIKVLRHIASGGSVANQSRAAREIGINRTTLLRILHTLEAERLIERVADGDDYVLGTGMIELAGRTIDTLDVTQVAQPVLKRIATELGLSCHLGILEGREVVYVVRATPDVHLVSNMRIGTRLPAHASSIGRAILAFLARDRVNALYSGTRLTAFTDKTPSSLGALHRQLDQIRSEGFVDARSAYETGIDSIAAPVLDHAGEPVGAINASGPESAFGDDERRLYIGRVVRAAAGELSQRLGYGGAVVGA